MAEVVGGALLSGFLNLLLDSLASKEVFEFFQGKKHFGKLLNELKITLLSANVLLNDAEEKQLADQNVKKWLDELKEVIYEADHVMDKINTETLRRKLEEGVSGSKASKFLNWVSTSSFCKFERTIKVEIEGILYRLKLLLDQKDFLGLQEFNQRRPSHSLQAPLVEEYDVYGREADKEALVELLLSDHDVNGHNNISVIPIVGMGGIGKTTLAHLVYNDKRVQEYFELRAWVTISEKFDVSRITKIIFEMITSQKCDVEDPYQLQNELKKALTGKKFLIVHDDVWNENYDLWELLKCPFEFGAHGSKIIVTTRSKIVASKMGNVRPYDLQTISNSDCWKLFAKHAFNNANYDAQSDLQRIGIEIVKKCKGLPLAVKSIAGLLRSIQNPEEWRWILQSDIWSLQCEENYNNNTTPALWLSYHYLPPHLKRCFAYLSIFPKDYEFHESEREKVILLWMAEGLLCPQKGKSMEDVGKEYLNALISRSFFQRSTHNESILYMHDLMHDLAMHISGEFCCMLNVDKDFQNFANKTRHLSYRKRSKDLMNLEGLSKAKCLRTLLALPLSYGYPCGSKLTQNILHELLLTAGGCLRVLCLCNSSFTEFPDSIGSLKYLRYLDLSMTKVKEIPCSICKLYNLQTLLLSRCSELTKLPINISSLINLRHLDISDTHLKEMPLQICNMKNLQTLSNFVLGENDGPRIKELGELQLLHGSLCITGLENVNNVGDVLEAKLKNKKYLAELTLTWQHGESNDSTKERKFLNALQPDTNLRQLKILGYRGTIFPGWVADHSYCNVVKVHIEGCKSCCLLPPFGQLLSLKELEIEGLDALESIGDEFFGTPLTQPFPSLESLRIRNMHSLEKWPSTGANQEACLFPCLKKIYLDKCKKLNMGLPACQLPSLKSTRIWECESMVAVFPTSNQQMDTAYSSLEDMEVAYCTGMESFSGMGLPSNLKQLRVRTCKMLLANRMTWNLQRLLSLKRLYLIGCEEVLHSFPEEGLLPPTLAALYITSFKHLQALNGKSLHCLSSLRELHIWDCEELECFPEEGLPLSLSSLFIYDCYHLRCRCLMEDRPKIQHIPQIEFTDKDTLKLNDLLGY